MAPVRNPAALLPSVFLPIVSLFWAGGLPGDSGVALAQGLFPQGVPSIAYHAAFHDFYDGEYRDALDEFEGEWRGAIKTPQSRWIDSICYHTMMGECYYQMGQLDRALEQYTAAVRLYLGFPDWMLRVQFPQSIRQIAARPTPWGTSGLGAKLGRYPSAMNIAQGQIDVSNQIRQSANGPVVIRQATYMPIEVQEIVRCTTLAIRRRTELLGPLSRHDPVTDELLAALSRRPGLPNHWSQAWVDVQLGVTLVAAGKQTEAIPVLNRSILAAGEYLHPLSATALFELGRLALDRGDYATATKSFQEASIAAYYFFDGSLLEESFRYGSLAHLVANQQGIYPPLTSALGWAKVKDLRQLRASVLLSMAESLLVVNQARQAASTLDQAVLAIGRRDMGQGAIGARLRYLQATLSFQQGNLDGGNAALAEAMGYMRHGSRWLLQLRRLDAAFTSGQISARGPINTLSAMELYEALLRDPDAIDWTLQPMESIAVLSAPHPLSYEYWFLIAMQRKSYERALEIADLARRHRFHSTLGFGGRLLSLRWILEAPETALDQQALLNRQDLLAQYPAYQRLAGQARKIHAALKSMPLVPQDSDTALKQRKALEQLAAISSQKEAFLREMAVRREKAALVFPPVRTTKDIRRSLPQGQVLLVFFVARGDVYGFLVNKTNYTYWRLRGSAGLSRRIVALLRAMGNYERNRQFTLDELADQAWKEPAQALLKSILEGSQADFTADFPELVIVPDGLLWYVPFEALQVEVNGQSQSLIDRFRIRYAPTASLAVPRTDRRAFDPAAQTAVALGKLYPRDDETVARQAFERFAKAVPRSVAVPASPLPAPSSVYSTLIDHLVVLDDIFPPEQGPYSWAPIQADRGKPGNLLGDWLSLPWGAPDVMIFPGFHTPAEDALKTANRAAPGAEVFLSACAMMAGGTQTLLLSRWRPGGQTSFDFVREFAQELPHTSPADAMQRAALVIASSRLDPEAEPRIKKTNTQRPLSGSHPFFWAAYMLLDSGIPQVPAEGENNAAPAAKAK